MSLLSRRCVVISLLCLLAVARCTEDTPPGWSSPTTPFVTSIHGDGPPVNTWGGNASVSTLNFVSLESYPGALCNGSGFSELAAASLTLARRRDTCRLLLGTRQRERSASTWRDCAPLSTSLPLTLHLLRHLCGLCT